jgi:hypothetical protein
MRPSPTAPTLFDEAQCFPIVSHAASARGCGRRRPCIEMLGFVLGKVEQGGAQIELPGVGVFLSVPTTLVR